MTSPLILPYRPASYWSLSLSYTMYMMHTVLMLLNSFAIAIWIDCDVGSDRHTTTTFWNVCVPPLLYPIHISCTSIALLFGHAIIRWLYILKLGKSMSDIHQTCMNIEVLYRVIVSSNEYVHFLAFNRKHIRYHNSSQYPCAVQGLSYYYYYYYYYFHIRMCMQPVLNSIFISDDIFGILCMRLVLGCVWQSSLHSGGRVLFFPYLSMYWILNSTLQVK
jgi:hypothetical protein